MEPDLLLSGASLDAAVGALARRNQHHFEAMSEPERAQAVETWHALALDVLTAVRATLTSEDPEGVPSTALGGRAVVVFEDGGEEAVVVHAAFHPELQEVSPGEVAGSPAQLTALALLEQLSVEDEPAPEPGG